MTENGEPFLPGPVFAAPYHLSGDPAGSEFTYGRYENPTWTAYEQAVGALEGGDALVFGSGMGAVSTLLLALLEPGDPIVIPSDAYYNVRELAHDLLPYEVREVPTDSAAVVEAAPGAKLVWVETPSNPGLDVVDIRAVAEACDGTLVVDNTLATPLGQRPLELGADYVMGSATKALSGHSDLLLGYVAARDVESVRTARGKLGTIAGPFEVWLAHRSLATLEVRLERECANALRLAQAIGEHVPVRYPGLPGDPAHETAKAQMDVRAGALLHAARCRYGRRFPRHGGDGHRGHELRRHAHDGRAPRPLGRRRRARGLHPPQRGVRGARRARPGRNTRVGAGPWPHVGSIRA